LIPVESGDSDSKSMIISTSREENYRPISFPQFQAALDKEQNRDKENNGSQTPKRINYEEVNNPMTLVQKKLRGDTSTTYSTSTETTKPSSMTSKQPSDTYSNKLNESVSKGIKERNN
jgi:hypothetical protein